MAKTDIYGWPSFAESLMYYGNYSKITNKPASVKHRKCKDELFLESLRQDGHSKKRRALMFKEYSQNKILESHQVRTWRHDGALHGITTQRSTKEAYSLLTGNLKSFQAFSRDFGKAAEISIRSGDPSALLTWIPILIAKTNDITLHGYSFPQLNRVIEKFNKAHPARSIVVCNRCAKHSESRYCKKTSRRTYCRECVAQMRVCDRCDGLCESEHAVMSADGLFMTWCNNCAGRAYNWTGDNFLHENPMPAAGVGTYHSSQQYIRQIGKAIEGLCPVGFELEFAPIGFTRQGRDTLSAKLKKLTEIVAGVEEDGSIRHLSGAEIVTNYGSLDVVLAGADAISEVLKGKAVSHSTNCCGLHVSLGRGEIDQWTLAKFVAFWNATRNRDFLKSFCRRWESGYCKPKSEKGKLTDQMSAMRPPEHIINCHDRRELVNTQNRHRVEVRAFRGTTNGETIKRCISLCVWLMAYCADSEDRKMRYSGFLDWCKTARRERGRDIFTPACITEFAESKGFLGQDNPRKIILSK